MEHIQHIRTLMNSGKMYRALVYRALLGGMGLTVALGLSACEPSNPGCRETADPAAQRMHAIFEVTSGGDGSVAAVSESFSVLVDNYETQEQIWDLEAGISAANIPNGKLVDGAGEDDFNSPWTWHLDSVDIEMAEVTTEVCDAMPSYVEAHKAEFISTVGRYCPWSARLVSVEIYFVEEGGGCG